MANNGADVKGRARPLAFTVDTPPDDFVGLFVRISAEFPKGEWFFIDDDGLVTRLKGEPGAPVTVLTLASLDDVSEIEARLGAEAGTAEGEGFKLIDAADQTVTYTWFSATITPDGQYVVAGSSGTFIADGARWVNTRITSNADRNQLRNFYATTALMKAALPVADWHGVLPAHSHMDDFGNVTGQFWSVHDGLYPEFLTSANHSGAMYTSLRSGGILSIEVLDDTTFQITAGKGFKTDFTDPSGQVDIEQVFWDQFDDQSVILADLFTLVGISWDQGTGVATVVKKSGTLWTNEERRTTIVLGVLNHSDGASIISATMNPVPSYNFSHGIMDYINAVGGVITGLAVDLANANLTWGTDAGTFTLPFVNYGNDILDPSVITHSAVSPVTFNYNHRDGGGGWTVIQTTSIDPDFYDTGTGSLVAVPTGNWQIQPDFLFGEGNFHVLQYGQAVFATLQLAKEAINDQTQSMERNPALASFQIVGYFVVQEGATDLTDAATVEYIVPVGAETVVVEPEAAFPSFESFFVGDYYDAKSQGVSIDAYSAQSVGADLIVFSQFRIRGNVSQTFDMIGAEKTAGSGSGTELRLGIYTDSGNRPDILIDQLASALAFDTNAAVEGSITLDLDPGIYWFASVHSLANRTYRAMNNVEGETLGVSSLGSTTNHYTVSSTFSFAALPANTGALSMVLATLDALRVQLRAS